MKYIYILYRTIIFTTLLLLYIGLMSNFSVFAQTVTEISDFEVKAKQAGINLEYLKTQSSISRYDIAKLLNTVECTDCIIPAKPISSYYSSGFWKDFVLQPGKDFRDVFYKEAVYNGESYYYCVATVADNNYMYGYPTIISPTCPGHFCGAKSMTKGEFAQILVNILTKYISNNYKTNWSNIKERLGNNKNNIYIANTFNPEDETLIDKKISECSDPKKCSIGPDYFRTYLKYCMYDLAGCDMKTRGWIGEGYWPIAELNILYKEGILEESNNFINTIHDPIDGYTAITTLSKIFPKTSCTFNGDYDCDGINNYNDNCPYDYNPSQKDTDNDKSGDVCDDDIDGDGIKNPIGIVDESGNINISSYQTNNGSGNNTISNWDNCILIKNPNQNDSNTNFIGDECDEEDIQGVSAATRIIGTGNNKKVLASVVVDYTPIENDWKWSVRGKNFYGKQLLFPIPESGMYTFTVESTKDPRRKASSSVVVHLEKPLPGLSFNLTSTRSSLPIIITTTPISIGGETIIRELQGGPQSQQQQTESNKGTNFLIRFPGTYTINAILKNGGETVAVARKQFIVNYNDIVIPNITIDKIIGKPNEIFILSTLSSIKKIETSRGDSTAIQSTPIQKHSYRQKNTYTIISNIVSLQNELLQDIKTVSVIDTIGLDSDKILNITPNTLKGNTNTQISFSLSQIGYNKTTIKNTHMHDGVRTIDNNYFLYAHPGIYYPIISETIGVCSATSWGGTIIIPGKKKNSCFNMLINNITPLSDIDSDGIDDICDDDIDGDGIKNIIGFIEYKEGYSGGSNITTGFKDIYIWNNTLGEQHFSGICSLDNCPFAKNTDQIDSNGSGIGDICKERYNTIGFMSGSNNSLGNTSTGIILSGNNFTSNGSGNILDSDGDGIPDIKDQCPLIKETFNGYLDEDGCPEIGNDNICEIPIGGGPLISAECAMCPCQYVVQSSDLLPGDSIRASLRSLTGNFLQSWSTEYTL